MRDSVSETSQPLYYYYCGIIKSKNRISDPLKGQKLYKELQVQS